MPMKTIQDFWKEMRERWHNAMPRFFKRLMWICGLISGSALAANEAACKFTQSYDRDGHPLKKPLPEATQPDAVNNSDVETVSPAVETSDIDPYNED